MGDAYDTFEELEEEGGEVSRCQAYHGFMYHSMVLIFFPLRAVDGH